MKNIGLYENSSKPDAAKYAEHCALLLKDLGTECYASPELIEKFDKDLGSYVKPLDVQDFGKCVDIAVSFGGDGTMLALAQALIKTNIPIMGVNVGRLGFLAEFSTAGLNKSIDDLITGNYRVVDRTVLETHVNGETIYALNDFVIDRKDSARMINVLAYSNEHLVANYRADGLIITTPTGSSAYSLSCGGPLIVPSAKVICLTPISPHSMTLRPIVIPDSNEITIEIGSAHESANLIADGNVYPAFDQNKSIIIRKSEERIKMIKPVKSSFYDLIRAKLLWSANAIDQQEAERNSHKDII